MFGGQSLQWQDAFHCTAQHKSSYCSTCPLGPREAMQSTADGGSQFPHVPHPVLYSLSGSESTE